MKILLPFDFLISLPGIDPKNLIQYERRLRGVAGEVLLHTSPGGEVVKATMANLVNAISPSHKNNDYGDHAEAQKLCIASHLWKAEYKICVNPVIATMNGEVFMLTKSGGKYAKPKII